MICTIAIGFGVILGAVKSFPSIQLFFISNNARQQANNEARMVSDTVRHLLSRGRPSTAIYSTPDGGLPNSDITFSTIEGNSYEIGWSSMTDTGSIFYREIRPGVAGDYRHTLAYNVTSFSFAWDDNDPSAISVKFRSDTPLDHSGKASSIYPVDLPPFTVRMEGN